jgi:hypothetical protein
MECRPSVGQFPGSRVEKAPMGREERLGLTQKISQVGPTYDRFLHELRPFRKALFGGKSVNPTMDCRLTVYHVGAQTVIGAVSAPTHWMGSALLPLFFRSTRGVGPCRLSM